MSQRWVMQRAEISVIVNPTAARGAVGREWPDMRSLLKRQGLALSDRFTEAPGHATELARQAAQKGVGTVIAVGGDGTVNEVVNGLLDGADPARTGPPEVSLGLISRGTGSDLARSLGLRGFPAAVRALTERTATRTIDLGEITYGRERRLRRLFINAAGLGFDGEVVEALLQRGSKRGGGTIPYLMQVFRSVSHYDTKRVRASVDGAALPEGHYTAFFACNGGYFAGGMRIAPKADLGDGLFDVVVIDALSRAGLLARLPSVYFGWHGIFPQVHMHKARELSVDTEDRLLIQADGELVGTAPATMRILPAALKVRV